MNQERNPQSSNSNDERISHNQEAGCLFALITNRRSVSRRNRATWFLRQLNKVVRCDPITLIDLDSKTYSNGDISRTKNSDEASENENEIEAPKQEGGADIKDIFLVSITSQERSKQQYITQAIRSPCIDTNNLTNDDWDQQYLVTPSTLAVYLSKNIATSIVLDLSPSVVSVSTQNDCVYLDTVFDALKRVIFLLVKEQEIPCSSSSSGSKPFTLAPKVFVTVIAYTPFVVAKTNQVLIQNRLISSLNIDQVLAELWISLTRMTQELHELVSNSCGITLEYESTRANRTAFVFPQATAGGIIRHPGSVLEDIYDLGLFSASLMPKLSRLSIVIISDGLFASTNNLNVFRLRSIAVSFVSLCSEEINPDACFGYTSYSDLMRFVSKSTQGIYITHQNLIGASQTLSKFSSISLLSNPLSKLFCSTLHSEINISLMYPGRLPAIIDKCDNDEESLTPKATATPNRKSFTDVHADQQHLNLTNSMRPYQIAKFFCVDQSGDSCGSARDCNYEESYTWGSSGIEKQSQQTVGLSSKYHDWRSYKQLERELDADFEQVLSYLLRDGYLIKDIHIKRRETARIVARLVLHWKHNLDLEQELSAPYWKNHSDPFDLNAGSDPIMRPFNCPLYGDTCCEIYVHGSYSFLHNLYCDKKLKRRSEYRDIAYKQFRALIDNVLQTHERLQYLSRFYRDSSLSKVPSFLLHGNSLLYEQPHTHKLTSTIENVIDETKTSKFQEYWQKISCLDTKSWKNLMHVHTLRLVLEHDQPKHKNIHCQNANGRYTHIQCRRALSAISNFIKSYASFALLEDSTYIKFIYNKDNDLREIETSATKGFIVIRINKLLPIVVIYLMFTSGILDSHRVQIVSYLENQLASCKIRNVRISTTIQTENILRSKTIYPSSDFCCKLIRSPLERMLKVYSRNFVSESLALNPTLGLPGSCPFNSQVTIVNRIAPNRSQPQTTIGDKNSSATLHQKPRTNMMKESYFEDYTATENSVDRYNLVFGKYLYGIRVVHTIAHLPHDLVQSLTTNVLAKISAILVNVRIKQGYHIAFNNSGILNLVVELMMQDQSHQQQVDPTRSATGEPAYSSTCLCQYIVFPPAITSAPKPSLIYGSNASSNLLGSQQTTSSYDKNEQMDGSKPGSLSGSVANSDNSLLSKNPFSNVNHEYNNLLSNDAAGHNTGEVKVVREYWTEQQYGTSTVSGKNHHRSLENLRYTELIDHLYLTDTKLFHCLLTYDILQLLCDKMSPFHELDLSLYQADRLNERQQISAAAVNNKPLRSLDSNNSSMTNVPLLEDPTIDSIFSADENVKCKLPSNLIASKNRDGVSRVPLIELTYKFSLVRFLDYCQLASLNVLLFKDRSDHFEPLADLDQLKNRTNLNLNDRSKFKSAQPMDQSLKTNMNDKQRCVVARKMSMDVNMLSGRGDKTRYDRFNIDQSLDKSRHQAGNSSKREHRSSYDCLNKSTTPLGNSRSAATLHGIMHQQQQFANYTLSSICSPSLNHLFLETLHKRLRQMHDKELKLTSSDRKMLADYLRKRYKPEEREDHQELEGDVLSQPTAGQAPMDQVDGLTMDNGANDGDISISDDATRSSSDNDQTIISYDEPDDINDDDGHIKWRCFMRKRNQENMMIVFIPNSLHDINKWMQFVSLPARQSIRSTKASLKTTESLNIVCPIFVFRCSSTMLNERLLSFLETEDLVAPTSASPLAESSDSDLKLHFGQPCKYLGMPFKSNDELDHDLPSSGGDKLDAAGLGLNTSNSSSTQGQDEKTIELVHFRAFLRKVKNTVLKSRFSSLNDAYLSELFIHKLDLVYYIQNVDSDTQKKYHVSAQLKSLAEFTRIYEDYINSLPKEQAKPCDQLLNSILLQKCGLFINQPIARFNESDPLMKQLHDKKLLIFMRCNYKIELPVLEENLLQSRLLRDFVTVPSGQQTYGSGLQNAFISTAANLKNQPNNFRYNRSHRPNYSSHHQAHRLSPNSLYNQSLTSNCSALTEQQLSSNLSPPTNLPMGSLPATANSSTSSSLNNQSAVTNSGARLMEIRYRSTTGSGSAYTPTNAANTSLNYHSYGAQSTTSYVQSVGQHSLIMTTSQASPRHSIISSSSVLQQSAGGVTGSTSINGINHTIIPSPSSNDSFILEAFRNAPCSIDEVAIAYNNDCSLEDNQLSGSYMSNDEVISLRHEAHMAEVFRRKSERRESHQYRRVLKSKTNYSQPHSAIDQALKRVDRLGRLEHFCLTPLLFSPTWRCKLAPVRDHTLETYTSTGSSSDGREQECRDRFRNQNFDGHTDQYQMNDERWHQMVCNNYIKEYEQYIQTLGFNSVQIRYPSGASGSTATNAGLNSSTSQVKSSPSSRKNSKRFSTFDIQHQQQQHISESPQHLNRQNSSQTQQQRTSSIHNRSRQEASVAQSLYTNTSQTPPTPTQAQYGTPSASQISGSATTSATTTAGPTPTAQNTGGYLIKFLNSGCLVFKVGFCKPYVYSILYSIEGERFNNTSASGGSSIGKSSRAQHGSGGSSTGLKMNNMTAFLDELDNIKVTMHLHSFTYDYHLRSMYSYISGRQMTFSPGYHLISFVDDFRKYYQKAPNYARNHILSGEVCVKNLSVNGQQLFNHIVTHNTKYNLDILEMSSELNAINRSVDDASAGNSMQLLVSNQSDRVNDGEAAFDSMLNWNSMNVCRKNANDYVLIELKREKVRHKDGKDPDIFDCGLLITHIDCIASPAKDAQSPEIRDNNCLTLRYFLLLTNQRDLYPKLVHSFGDNVINLGCHRPIRLTSVATATKSDVLHRLRLPSSSLDFETLIPNPFLNNRDTTSRARPGQINIRNRPPQAPTMISGSITTTVTTLASDLEDAKSQSNDVLLSSGELSGPASILSTAPSVISSTSTGGVPLMSQQLLNKTQITTTTSNSDNDTGGSGVFGDSRLYNEDQTTAEVGRSQREYRGGGGGDGTIPFSSIDLSEIEQLGTASEEDDRTAPPAEEAADALAVAETNTEAVWSGQYDRAAGASFQPIARSSSFRLMTGQQKRSSLQVRHLSAPPEGVEKSAPSQLDNCQRTLGTPTEQGLANASMEFANSIKYGCEQRHDEPVEGNKVLGADSLASDSLNNKKIAETKLAKSKPSAICDEEITYLGYFSSDEMDMLKFLQEKTNYLRSHIEQIVRASEVHYRRDYLWRKLMQQKPQDQPQQMATSPGSPTALTSGPANAQHQLTVGSAIITESTSSKFSSTALVSDHQPGTASNCQAPLSVEELMQLLDIVHAIDLAALDQQLTTFASMNLNWYLKLLKAFQDLRQSPMNTHRIYQVRASKTLLLFIDPRCAGAFILLSLDQNRGSIEMSLLLKDKQEAHIDASDRTIVNNDTRPSSLEHPENSGTIELDLDCRELISDFINFCASFMWSTFLTS